MPTTLHLTILAGALVIAGCLNADAGDADSSAAGGAGTAHGDGTVDVHEIAPDRPYSEEWWMPECYDPAFAFSIPTGHAQSFLPSGYTPAPFAEAADRFVLAGAGLPVTSATALAGRAMVLVVPHYCPAVEATSNGATATARMDEAWVWIIVNQAHADWGMPTPLVSAYELSHAGGEGHVLDVKRALGWTVVGDRVAPSSITSDATGAGIAGQVFDGDETLFEYVVAGGQESTRAFGGPLQVWHEAPSGTALLSIELPNAPAKILLAREATCSIAAGSDLARLLDATSCDESKAEGTFFGAAVQPPHDVRVTLDYRPRSE